MRKFTNGKKWILMTILILLVTVIAGCGKGGKDAASELDVSLSERELLLEVGDSKKLELESETLDVDKLNVSWESAKTSVATVDEDGTVTAVAGGEARVSVIVEYEEKEYTTSCVVTVKTDEKTYSSYKIRWYTQKQDRMGYDITEESFEREVGSKVELTVADAYKKLPNNNYTFNEGKSILTGTVKESQAGCILEVYFDVAEITYSIDYYYESDVKLGYYMTKETKNYKAYAFTKVAAPEEVKEGFVVNESVNGSKLSSDSVDAGTTLSVYCDRIRSKVTVDYISGKESKTYTCIYGVGLIDAPKDVFSDSLDLYQVAAFINGEKKEATAELMKNITADTTVAFKLDGNGFVYANQNGTSTITNNYTAKKTPCYVLLNGKSNIIYLSATYTTTGSSSNTFGITLESGGTSREILFSNQGVAVYKDHTTSGGVSSAKDASATYSYAGVYNDGNTFVWAQNSSGYDYTNVVSVVRDMLKNKEGGSYDICWAVYDGVLYASIEGETVLRLPLKYLEESWTADKQYTIGLSTYDTNAWGDKLKISNIKPVFGNEAKALLVTDKQFESSLAHHMGYDVFTGAYLSASKSEAGYLYGEEAKGNIGISASIEWVDIDNTNSAVGITVKVGDESVQYVVEGENRSIRSQRNHKWEGINKIGTQIMKEQVPFLSDGKTEVTAFVKDGYFYVMYKGVQVQCINMLSLFPEYTPDSEVSVGICSWDAKNGLAKFTDVKQLSADDVNTIENVKEWGFYSEKLTVDDYSFGDASVSKSQAGRKRAYLFGSSEIWQIEGRISRLDDTTNDLLMGFEISSGDNTILILAHNNGFRKIINENWADTTISNNVNTANYKSTLYAFNNIVSTKLFNSNGSDTRTQTFIDYKAVLYNDTLYVWFKDEAGNEGLCWRIPLTEEEFGSFEKGSAYNMTLYFAETDTDASMTNLAVKMGYQVTEQTDFVEDNSGKQYDFGEAIETIETNINRWDNNFRQKTISGMLAEELGTGVAGHNGAYAYLNGSDTDVFLSATYEMNANVTPGHLGISITDGEEVRSIFYKGYGVFVLQDHAAEYSEIPVIPEGQNHHYFNTGIRAGYVWVYSGTTNAVSKMLTAQDSEHEHEVKWAITDGVLYGMVDDFVFFRIAVSDLCATWDENTKFQIGFEQWYVLNNGDVKTIKDIEVSFGEEALSKMVTDKKLSNVASAGMTYEVFHGNYLPNSAAGSKYLYGEATSEDQVLEAAITQIDKANSTFGCGITVKAGEQSAQIIGYGKVDKVRLIKNYSYGFMFPFRDTVTPIATQWIEAPVFDENGICKVKVVIKDYTLYLFYNEELAGSIDIYKLLPNYKEGDDVAIGIYGINPLEGLATFSDISFAKGEAAVKDITTTDDKEWELFTNASGTISENGTKMTGNGKTHIAAPQTGQSNCGVIYGIATSMPQMLTTDIVLENTTGDLTNGISVECNGKSVEFYTFAAKKYIRIQLNKAWGVVTYYNYPTDVTAIYDENGVCNVTAIVKDGTFYLICGDKAAYKVQMDILFPGYTNDKAVRLGVCTWDSKNGVSSFENIAFSAGASVTVDSNISYKTIQLLIKSVNGSVSHNEGNEISITGSSQRPSMLLNGESTIWEVSGTMERTDTSYGTKLFAGFMVQQGDKSLGIKACNKGLYFDVEKSSHSNSYDYNSNLKDSTNKYVLNTLNTTMFWDKFASGSDKDIEFKAVIYEDTLYVWFDGVPCWRIDLTENIPNVKGNTMREGYTAGTPYSFGFAVHTHSTSVTYKDLTVKTSDADGSIKEAVEEFNETVGN